MLDFKVIRHDLKDIIDVFEAYHICKVTDCIVSGITFSKREDPVDMISRIIKLYLSKLITFNKFEVVQSKLGQYTQLFNVMDVSLMPFLAK